MLINSLSIEPDDTETIPVKAAVKRIAVDGDQLTNCIQVILNRCHDNWQFSRFAIQICNNLLLEVDKSTVRHAVLSAIQANFKRMLFMFCVILIAFYVVLPFRT